MKEKSRDQRKNLSYPEIGVKRVWVNKFQLYMIQKVKITVLNSSLTQYFDTCKQIQDQLVLKISNKVK